MDLNGNIIVQYLILTGLCVSNNLMGHQVVLEKEDGEYVIEFNSESSFCDVIDSIGECVRMVELNAQHANFYPKQQYSSYDDPGFYMVIVDGKIVVKPLAMQTQVKRDFLLAPSVNDKADIGYIITTLANASLIKIGTLKGSLEQAGDRIDQIHPLQFLAYVFTDEQLAVDISNIRERSWVWSKFFSGLENSLKEENKLNNLQQFLDFFAETVNVDVNFLLPSIQAGKWEKFIDALIKYVPRKEGHDRYNM